MDHTTQGFIAIAETRLPRDRPSKHRAMGAILGAAVGDALGAPFEFMPQGTYPERFPSRVVGGVGEMVGGGSFGWQPGEFTDDTQMAMLIAESILECGGYDPDDVWGWFRAWERTARDVGANTRRSLSFDDWRDVPRDGTNRGAGNGALMRAFPVAVALLDASDEIVRAVVLHQAALTHQDPAAGWGAWIAVELMRSAIIGDDPFLRVDGLLAALPADVRAGFSDILAPTWDPTQSSTSNGTVWGCLAQALWAVRTTATFEDAVVAAVSLGHDADTVACVTGAIAGAVYGVQSIPSRWTTYVHGAITSPSGEVLHYDAITLQNMTCRLLGAAVPSSTPLEGAAGPVEVAPGVFAADLLGAASVPTDWAVVSLCLTGGRFAEHPTRRQVFMIDESGDHNSSLLTAVSDAVDAVDAFRAEDRTVVVHCHGGRSRTGLVLKAWKMRADGVDERAAHQWLADRWYRYADYNASFLELLRTQW